MKIAILHSGDLEKVSPGGISQYIEKIIKYNKTNDITVFGTIDFKSNYKIGIEYERYIDGKSYKFIPISNNTRKPLSIFYFINLFKYFSCLNNYDVVYAQRMEYALPFTFSKVKNKLIMAIHGSGKYSTLYWGNFIGSIHNFLEKISIRNSKKVIILLKREEFGLPYYKKKFKKYNKKFEYGKVPIDLDLFKKLNKNDIRKEFGIKENQKVISYFGRIDNNPKRVLLIPDIIKSIKCIIIGDGEDRNKLQQIVLDYELENNIIIKGRLNHGDDLIKWINCSDISLILSSFEGICMSALESIACGIPVISTDVGDISEYIDKGKNGKIILNSNDEKYLIDNFSRNILEAFETNIELNEIYKQYDGKVVMKELNDLFNIIKEGNSE